MLALLAIMGGISSLSATQSSSRLGWENLKNPQQWRDVKSIALSRASGERYVRF